MSESGAKSKKPASSGATQHATGSRRPPEPTPAQVEANVRARHTPEMRTHLERELAQILQVSVSDTCEPTEMIHVFSKWEAIDLYGAFLRHVERIGVDSSK